MNWPIPIAVLLAIVASVTALASAGYAWRRRNARGSRAFAAAQLAAALWLVAGLPGMPYTRFPESVDWTSVQHTILAMWALAMLFFCIRYTGRPGWMQGRICWLFAFVPALSVLVLWFGPDTVLAATSSGALAQTLSNTMHAFGPGSRMQISYEYALMIAAIALMTWHGAVQNSFRHRQQPALLVAAIGIPALSIPGFQLFLPPLPSSGPSLVFMSLGVFAATLALLRPTYHENAKPTHSRLFNNMNEPVFITDLQNRVMDVNPAVARLLRTSRESCVGQPIARLLPGLDIAAALASPDAVVATLDWSLSDGQVRRYVVSVSPLRDGGRLQGHAFLLHDATALSEELSAQQQAAAAAQEASRLSSEFLAVVSHEVRTPMQAVVGMTGLLLGTELTDEQRDYIETIRSSGDSMLAIVNNVLDFSKIETGQIELEREPFDPVAAIEDTLAIFAGQAAMKNLELAYVLGNDVPATVIGDVTRFRQVLTNLVGNAVKFTDRGEVTVSLNSRTDGARVRLHVRVRDTGIGIPRDRMDRLFQSFSQVDASTARRYGGTGLGLAICKRLCKIMGGDVWVESHTGVGSTFHFTVVAEPVESPGPALARDPALDGRAALVVDDNPASREMLSRILSAWGMQVETVESGWAALQALEKNSLKNSLYDVVLIDMHMPVMDGEACARRIRAMRYRPEPRLVMMLALTDSGTRTRAAELGLASVVAKPLKRSQLRGALSDIFAAGESGDAPAGVRPTAVQPEPRRETAVLLADDNRVGQRVTSALLRRLGYQADVVSSGTEVLSALQEQPYDIVLMDVYMPEMDGLTTTQKIREEYAADRQPYVIALTASAISSDKQQCLNAGMDDYLSKPVSIGELQEALRRAETSSQELRS